MCSEDIYIYKNNLYRLYKLDSISDNIDVAYDDYEIYNLDDLPELNLYQVFINFSELLDSIDEMLEAVNEII